VYICVLPLDMGAHRHGQGGGGKSPPWKCKVFCVLVVTVKRSVDQLFMHYLHNFCQLLGVRGWSPSGGLGAKSPDPHRVSTPGLRWGTSVSRPPNWPTSKKSCGRPCPCVSKCYCKCKQKQR